MSEPVNHERVANIKHVRATLGCGLREAHDFYEREPRTWSERLADEVERTKGGGYFVSPEQKIRDAIIAYYKALDDRELGVIAMEEAFKKIEQVLGMSWTPGASKEKPKSYSFGTPNTYVRKDGGDDAQQT